MSNFGPGIKNVNIASGSVSATLTGASQIQVTSGSISSTLVGTNNVQVTSGSVAATLVGSSQIQVTSGSVAATLVKSLDNNFFNVALVTSGSSSVCIDKSTFALVNISYEHQKIHAGSSYQYGKIQSIAAADSGSIMIHTPSSSKKCHMLVDFSTDGVTTFRLYENPTFVNIAASGTAQTGVINRNRNYKDTKPTEILLYASSSVSDSGSLLKIRKVGIAKSQGGLQEDLFELVLLPDSNYIYCWNNTDSGTKEVSFALKWYEHANLQDE
jgi:hypothetical protein